jgi:hypothetical protein
MSMLDWSTYRQQLIVAVGENRQAQPRHDQGLSGLSARPGIPPGRLVLGIARRHEPRPA